MTMVRVVKTSTPQSIRRRVRMWSVLVGGEGSVEPLLNPCTNALIRSLPPLTLFSSSSCQFDRDGCMVLHDGLQVSPMILRLWAAAVHLTVMGSHIGKVIRITQNDPNGLNPR